MEGKISPQRQTKPNLSDDIYRRLRGEIVHGVLRPNEALVEADLAERLNVSRTPIRESLKRLEADRLIVSQRRRWVVYEYKLDEIAEIYEVRAALESWGARMAALKATPEQIQAIVDFRPRATAIDLEVKGRITTNEEFHDLVIEAANNSRLTELLHQTRLYYFNHQVARVYTLDEWATSAKQHAAIIDAIVDRNPLLAGEAAREHAEFSLSMILGAEYH
jgi:DNA-binding GntR family transcriptional regulator